MTEPYFDNKKQLERIQAHLIQNEILYAVIDLKGIGSGFLGISDRRVIFYDQAFLTKKKAVVSIPYKHIVGIAASDEGVLFKTSEITLMTSAGNYTFEFMGPQKAHYAYTCILTIVLRKETQTQTEITQ